MTFKAVLSGFKTKEQAKAFLNWYEGQGEQDEGLIYNLKEVGASGAYCNVHVGMIELVDGFEYKVKVE